MTVTRPQRPVPGPTRTYRFPRFAREQLGSGLTLVTAPVTKLPVVSVLAVVDSGALADPRGREGTAQLTAKLLLEGTESIGGADLADRFERLGAAVDAYADWDVTVVSMTVLAGELDRAFALLAEMLQKPAFPEREVDRLKEERLAELLLIRSEPRSLADERFAKQVYGADSRYAISEGGDEVTVNAITRAEIARFHREQIVPGATTMIVVGDVSSAAAKALVERHLGAWRGAATPRATTSDAAGHEVRTATIVAKSDAPQSEIRVGHVAVPRTHPDYFHLSVMNAILGGLFNSRINMNLREAHAYTYGAFSAFDWRRQAGPFVVSTAVRTDVTAAAVREILGEIDRIRTGEVTNEELSLATSYLDGVFPIRYETTSAIAAALANLIIFGLPDDYFDTYREHIRGVTVADVLSAAKKHIAPERLQLVVVGDPSGVTSQLEELGVGAVAVEAAAERAPEAE